MLFLEWALPRLIANWKCFLFRNSNTNYLKIQIMGNVLKQNNESFKLFIAYSFDWFSFFNFLAIKTKATNPEIIIMSMSK